MRITNEHEDLKITVHRLLAYSIVQKTEVHEKRRRNVKRITVGKLAFNWKS